MSNVRAAMAMLGVSFVDASGYLKDRFDLAQEVGEALLKQPADLRPIFVDVLWKTHSSEKNNSGGKP